MTGSWRNNGIKMTLKSENWKKLSFLKNVMFYDEIARKSCVKVLHRISEVEAKKRGRMLPRKREEEKHTFFCVGLAERCEAGWAQMGK